MEVRLMISNTPHIGIFVTWHEIVSYPLDQDRTGRMDESERGWG
jgi:hypothetical protein